MEESFNTNDIFTLMTNDQNKILHMTYNCIVKLRLSKSYLNSTVYIEDIFPELTNILE